MKTQIKWPINPCANGDLNIMGHILVYQWKPKYNGPGCFFFVVFCCFFSHIWCTEFFCDCFLVQVEMDLNSKKLDNFFFKFLQHIFKRLLRQMVYPFRVYLVFLSWCSQSNLHLGKAALSQFSSGVTRHFRITVHNVVHLMHMLCMLCPYGRQQHRPKCSMILLLFFEL